MLCATNGMDRKERLERLERFFIAHTIRTLSLITKWKMENLYVLEKVFKMFFFKHA